MTEKEKQAQLEKLLTEAKQHAVSEQKIYIIYVLPDGGYAYMAGDEASRAGIQPVRFVSHLVPIDNGTVSGRPV